MHRTPLIIILVLAVSFQSVSAVYDLHQTHQSGVEHLEFEHDHDQLELKIDNQDSQKSYDCHHCCHCHGSHLTSLLPPKINLTLLYGNQIIPNLNQTLENAYISRLLRPPKA
jgi:hypothetical protein